MMYASFFKRFLDFLLSLTALLLLSPFLLFLTLIGALAMRGNPFFVQKRPGKRRKDGRERIISLIKFRTMSNARDEQGHLLPDEKRLNAYGRFLRSTSADELPSLINIVKGDLALVGPRPQLVRDMVFMTPEQRRRHEVRPGLTGLAQVNGRNSIAWEDKLAWDLEYLNRGITLGGDLRILFRTVGKVLGRKDVVREGTASDMDFGDWLLQEGRIDEELYRDRQEEALAILREDAAGGKRK